MTSQNTRFIDVTRTYIPVNPNAFPDSLHMTREGPEERVPVMAYKGYNFLPTAYGYRSFFGTNQELGIDAIAERVDFILQFQNNSFENILIALCDSGIWYKSAGVAGAWTQIKALSDNRDSQLHFTWTYTVINDALYCYRQNGADYQKITSSASAPGFVLENVVPNFLNMAAQQGIFRAGGRLGFWDSSDATAWSNLDDFADFTPSVETLANVTTFASVVGRIVTIKSHGEGFMIYATKSVVYIREVPQELFQFDPGLVLDVAGIAYPHEVVAGVPDSIHYVYTNIGLYQIQNANPEIIVPEVTDYIKESTGPKYLRFLEGRYLAIQSLDPNYINGIPQFSDEEIPATIITFPGANLDLADAVEDAKTQGSTGFCPVLDGLSNGAYNQPEEPDPTVVWRPQYTAFLSSAGEINPDVDWTTDPCFITNLATMAPFAMTPVGIPTFDQATTDINNKLGVSGEDAYVDGNWTIERFTQAQLAIWKLQEDNLQAKLNNILGRSHVSTRTYENPTEITSFTATTCDIGRFVTAYSGARFGFSKCEFWLTRFAIAAADLKVRKSERITSVFVPQQDVAPTLLGWEMGAVFGSGPACEGLHPTPATAWNTCAMASFPPPDYGGYIVGEGDFVFSYQGTFNLPYVGTGPNGYTVNAQYACPEGFSPIGGSIYNGCRKAAYYQVTEQNVAYIDAVNAVITPTPETAYCKLTSWKDIVSGTVIPADDCTAPSETGDDKTIGDIPVEAGDDGTFCSNPFDPFIIPGTPAVEVNWPEQTVVIPSGTFFLQTGSAAPLYPTFEGAWVYDTHLKKWGIYKGRHKQLLDYSPINSYAPSEKSYARFGIMGGILAEGGKLYLFDGFPIDSTITYGKVGYYRQGVTSVEECHIAMKTPCDFSMTIETSLEGTNLTNGLTKTENFVNTNKGSFYGGYTGRWHNIKIAGRFDISYLEFRGIAAGKR